MQVTVLEETNSGENKVKLTGVVLSEEASDPGETETLVTARVYVKRGATTHEHTWLVDQKPSKRPGYK